MNKLWNLREYREGDEYSIIKLHEKVFSKPKNMEWWLWQYKRNPSGQPIIVLAEAEDIIGQYALIPLRVKVGNTICSGSLSLDTMVHPDYRGQHIFTTLAKKAYDLAFQRGFQFVIGFPNKNSYPGFINNLQWINLCDTSTLWVKPLDINNLLLKLTGGKKIISKTLNKPISLFIDQLLNTHQNFNRSDLSITKTLNFDERYNLLFENTFIRQKIMVVRDKFHLNWRYIEKPNGDYMIFSAEDKEIVKGYIILKCIQNYGLRIGFIVDILTLETNVSQVLISTAIKYFESKKIDIIGCVMFPDKSISRCFKQQGFFLAPNQILPEKIHVVMKTLSLERLPISINNHNNWFITWGDNDGI